MKKILALFLAFIMMFSAVAPVLAANDYEEAGNFLKDLGLLAGNTKGDLMLENNLKREDMVIMITRLYGKEEEASKFVGVNKFKDLTPKHKHYIPYITWAASKGLISGHTDGTFGITQEVTVQQYQSVLLRTLDYAKDSKDWQMVPELAKAYGLMEDLSLNPSSKLKRGEMARMTLNTLRQEKNGTTTTLADSLNIDLPALFTADSKATVEANTVKFEGNASGADNLWIEVRATSSNIDMPEKLAPIPLKADGSFIYEMKDLEVGKYEYRLQSGSKYTEYKAFEIKTQPFKLDSASADNLKEIHIRFTQGLDKAIASIPSNYSTSAGTIDTIRFEDDDRTVILTLNEIMTINREYSLSISNLISKSGEKIEKEETRFEAKDNDAPEIRNIHQLGDKGLRIYFSEPVKRSLASNFRVDGKNLFLKPEYSNNHVTLMYPSSFGRLSTGKHEIEMTNIEDYSGKKLIDKEFSFTIESDSRAPLVKDVSSTTDRVIIEFDKDLDPSYISNRQIYWSSDRSRYMYPQSVKVIENILIADFSNNLIPVDEDTLYLVGIRDYFGNKFSESVTIKPIVDVSIPEVRSITVSNDYRTINVVYNKNVIGSYKEDYTLVDGSNKKIEIKEVKGSGKEFIIELYRPLALGNYELEIDGVEDALDKYNTIVRYRKEIQVIDRQGPEVISHPAYENNIILNFSKEMDPATVQDPSKYIMVFDGKQHNVPANSSFMMGQDNKSLTILLPEYFGNTKIMVGRRGNLTGLILRDLKDVNGNNLDPIITTITFDESSSGNAKAIDYYKNRPGRQGVLTESDEIKIRFNMPILYASRYDFDVDGREIIEATADGSDIVTILLRDRDLTSIGSDAVYINRNNELRTYIDTGVESGRVDVWDEIPPRIESRTSYLDVNSTTRKISIPFTEALESSGSDLYARDLKVVRLADNKILTERDFATSLDKNDPSLLIVEILKPAVTSEYSIELIGTLSRDTLSYIRDRDGNLALPSQVYITNGQINKQ